MDYQGDNVYYVASDMNNNDGFDKLDFVSVQKKFIDFITVFKIREKTVYLDRLIANVAKNNNFLEVSLTDLEKTEQKDICVLLKKNPKEVIPKLEAGLKDILFDYTTDYSRLDDVPDIMLNLYSEANPASLRELSSTHVNELVVIRAIVISATKPIIKAKTMVVRCKYCGDQITIPVVSGFARNNIPRECISSKMRSVHF